MPRKIVLEPNGPAVVDGGVLVTADREIALEEGVDCLLCRCGGTKNAPFCDGSTRATDLTLSSKVQWITKFELQNLLWTIKL